MKVAEIKGMQFVQPKIKMSGKTNSVQSHNLESANFKGSVRLPDYGVNYYINSNPISFGAGLDFLEEMPLPQIMENCANQRAYIEEGLKTQSRGYIKDTGETEWFGWDDDDCVKSAREAVKGPVLITQLAKKDFDYFEEFFSKIGDPKLKYDLLMSKFKVTFEWDKVKRPLFGVGDERVAPRKKTQHMSFSEFTKDICEDGKDRKKLRNMIFNLCKEDDITNSMAVKLLNSYAKYFNEKDRLAIQMQIKELKQNPRTTTKNNVSSNNIEPVCDFKTFDDFLDYINAINNPEEKYELLTSKVPPSEKPKRDIFDKILGTNTAKPEKYADRVVGRLITGDEEREKLENLIANLCSENFMNKDTLLHILYLYSPYFPKEHQPEVEELLNVLRTAILQESIQNAQST